MTFSIRLTVLYPSLNSHYDLLYIRTRFTQFYSVVLLHSKLLQTDRKPSNITFFDYKLSITAFYQSSISYFSYLYLSPKTTSRSCSPCWNVLTSVAKVIKLKTLLHAQDSNFVSFLTRKATAFLKQLSQ